MLHDIDQTKGVPKEYNLFSLSLQSNNSAERIPNTFVFTEKDLPGYRAPQNALFSEEFQGQGRSHLYEEAKRDAKKKENHAKRWSPYIRKAIPSKTESQACTGCPVWLTVITQSRQRSLERWSPK